MATLPNGFQIWDYLVFLLTLVLSLGIGVFFAVNRGGQKTQGEYLLGSRSMSLLPVAISMVVSFQSAILILGTPAEMYLQGTEYYEALIGNWFGFFFAGIFVIPLMYPLRLTSSLEYLEKRYRSRAVRLIGTFSMILMQIMYMGVASFAPAVALEAVTGIPVWISLLAAGLITTIYTSIGGIKAVIWSDVFQGTVMVGGMLAILIQGTLKVGGFGRVWEINDKWERIKFFTVDIDPRVRHTVFSLVLGSGLGSFGYGFQQTIVQRYSSLPTLGKAQMSVFLHMAVSAIPKTVACCTGIVMFAYYADRNCDLLSLLDNSNQLIPYFVMEILAYPAIPGFFMASLFAGALSSMSSSMNSIGAVTWEDLLRPSLEKHLNETTKTLIIKIIVAIYGCMSIGISYLMTFVDGTVIQAITMMISPLNGAISAIFLLGALLPFVNKYGAIAGAIAGASIASWQAIGSFLGGVESLFVELPHPNGTCGLSASSAVVAEVVNPTNTTSVIDEGGLLKDFYSISYMYISAIAVVICCVTNIIVSLLTRCLIPEDEREVPTMYQIPVMTRLLGCLPESWLYNLNCCREFYSPQEIIAQRSGSDKNVEALRRKEEEQERWEHGHYRMTVVNVVHGVENKEFQEEDK